MAWSLPIINDYGDEVALLEGIYAIDFFASDDKEPAEKFLLRKKMRLVLQVTRC